MELDAGVQTELSPQAHVFALEELLKIILEYATPNATKKELLLLRRVGKVWEKCVNKLFKTPPLKIKLDTVGLATLTRMYHFQVRNQYRTLIPMEITMPPNWVSTTTLIFLRAFSNIIEILHLNGIEGVETTVVETPFLPELKTLTVNAVRNVYYGRGRISEFVQKLVRGAPKLEVFKVIYDEQIVKHFTKPVNQSPFPEFTTHIKADCVIAENLARLMEKSNLRKLECAEIDFMLIWPCGDGLSGTVSRILEQSLVHTTLKKLKLNVHGCMEDFILAFPLPNLEEFESNMPIVTFNFDRRASLAFCFPKLVKLTLAGSQLINLTTFVIGGSKYENLENLVLRHNRIVDVLGHSDDYTPSMQRRQSGLLSKIYQQGFPATPNLVSLEFKDFPISVTNVVLPRIFQNSEKLKQLTVSVQDLKGLCAHFLRRENNLLRGTTFNLLTSLTIHNKYSGWKNCGDLVEGTLSIIMTDLKTLRLGENVRVKRSIRNKWLKSGRNIVGDRKNFILS